MGADIKASLATEPKVRVFLSYSRTDKDFTRKLALALTGLGYVADFDQSEHDPANIETGISAEDDWWKRLQDMIAAAEAMVLIVSPHSVASQVCGEEIAYARALGKRVNPVLLAPIDVDQAPPRLAALNVKLSFTDEGAFERSLAELAAVLDVDVAWHREGARLSALAVIWDGEGQSESRLLASGAVSEAEAWSARRPANAPPPGELLLSYLAAGRVKAETDRNRLLTTTGRAFVKPAEQALSEGRYDAALRLAAAGVVLSEECSTVIALDMEKAAKIAASRQRVIAILRGGSGGAAKLAIAPDGRMVAALKRGQVIVWDVPTQRLLMDGQDEEGTFRDIGFSADGKRILAVSGSQCEAWDIVGAHLVASAFRSSLGRKEDATSGARVALNAPSMIAATRSHPSVAEIWDLAASKKIGCVGQQKRSRDNRTIQQVSLSPDGALLLLPIGERVLVYNAKRKRRQSTLRGHTHFVVCGAVSNDNKRIVTGGHDSTARIWDARNGRQLVVLESHARSVLDVCFGSEGRRIATASADGTIGLWGAQGQFIASLKGDEARVLASRFSDNGWVIASASQDGCVRVWDAHSQKTIEPIHWMLPLPSVRAQALDSQAAGTEKIRVPVRSHYGDAAGKGTVRFSISASGTRAITFDAMVSDKDIPCVWDLASGEMVAKLVGHTGEVRDAKFSPDESRIVTASWDKTARVWDARSGCEVDQFEAQSNLELVEFSPEGDLVLMVGFDRGRVVRMLWDVSRTVALVGDPIEVIAASLTNGRGARTESERADLLMQAAPDDLYAALMGRLTTAQRESVARRAEILARPMHPDCYLPSS
jgi:WD40 repeat protein